MARMTTGGSDRSGIPFDVVVEVFQSLLLIELLLLEHEFLNRQVVVVVGSGHAGPASTSGHGRVHRPRGLRRAIRNRQTRPAV